jgi:hypothetical protein
MRTVILTLTLLVCTSLYNAHAGYDDRPRATDSKIEDRRSEPPERPALPWSVHNWGPGYYAYPTWPKRVPEGYVLAYPINKASR